MGSRLACIFFQGGTDRGALFFRETQLQTSLRKISAHLLIQFLFDKKGLEISRRLSPKNMVEGGCKSRGARFEVESSEKKSAPLSVPIEKRVHPYLFRFRKRVHPYLFRPKKECRPICSALKNDAGQPGPHLYLFYFSLVGSTNTVSSPTSSN